MELTGKIIAVLPERTGVGRNSGNEWKAQEYVLETINEQYPHRMCFEVFGGDRIAQFNIQLGETMTVSFDIDANQSQSGQYNGRWFNRIRAWKVDRNVAAQPAAPSYAAPVQPAAPSYAAPAQPAAPAPQAPGEGTADDLPF